MTVTVGPNLGLLIDALAGEQHFVELQKLLRGIDGLLMGKVISAALTAPPGSAANGDAYIVGAIPTGAWSGQATKVARYYTVGTGAPAWEFFTPKNGWLIYDLATSLPRRFNGTAWVDANQTVDAAHVDAAGAVMNTDTSAAAMAFVVDEDNMVSNSDTKVPTQQSVKAYVDGRVAGGAHYKTGYDAATNSPDLDTSPSGVKNGDMYTVTVAGTFFTTPVAVGDFLIAEIDGASTDADWTILEKNLVGLAALAFLSTVGTAQIDNDAVTLAKLANIATARIIGRTTAGVGDPEELTVAQARVMLGIDGIEILSLLGGM